MVALPRSEDFEQATEIASNNEAVRSAKTAARRSLVR